MPKKQEVDKKLETTTRIALLNCVVLHFMYIALIIHGKVLLGSALFIEAWITLYKWFWFTLVTAYIGSFARYLKKTVPQVYRRQLYRIEYRASDEANEDKDV